MSAKDQNTERQIIKMKQRGIEDRYIFIDKKSGKDFDREKYQAMLLLAREGDELYLDALDRLGRNYDGIISEWKRITREMKVDIIVLENEELFDSRKFKSMGDIGKLLEDQFLSMLSYVAEQERKKNKTRQSEGIDVAMKKGVKFGRPKFEIQSDFEEVYVKWRDKKTITAKEAMDILRWKPNTFYRRVKEYESIL